LGCWRLCVDVSLQAWIAIEPEYATLFNGAIMPPQIVHITLALAFVSVWAIVGQIMIRSNDS
jgi:hypothetical protein